MQNYLFKQKFMKTTLAYYIISGYHFNLFYILLWAYIFKFHDIFMKINKNDILDGVYFNLFT